jgi:hypothetical protein
MEITTTTNEGQHGNRKTRANHSPAAARHAAEPGRDLRRDSTGGASARPANRPAPSRRAPAGFGREDGPLVDLTIDMSDEQVVEAVARLLLNLTRKDSEPEW